MQRFLAEVREVCLNILTVLLAIFVLSFPVSLFMILSWPCWLIGGTPHVMPIDTYQPGG